MSTIRNAIEITEDKIIETTQLTQTRQGFDGSYLRDDTIFRHSIQARFLIRIRQGSA